MYCPSCGQERISHETSFCSRCGFLLTGTAELLQTGGMIPQTPAWTQNPKNSPQKRGLKQGLFIFLLTFLLVPIIAIVSVALGLRPWGIPIAAILLFVGGLLRMAYALMFESPISDDLSIDESIPSARRGVLNRQPGAPLLTSTPMTTAQDYVSPAAGNWRDTKDLEPASVTEGTTKLLEKDELDQ